MTDHFSPSQQAVIDRDNRLSAAAGFALSQVFNDLYAQIASGAIGITADAQDVDAVALGGGTFTRDKDTSPGTTLNFSWKASRFHNGKANVTVAAGTLALTTAATNYVEVDRSGTVSVNTTGFTSGRLPLWQIATGASSYSDANVISKKPILTLIGSNGVDGSMLSQAAQTKEVTLPPVTISATTTIKFISAGFASALAALAISVDTTITTSDTNYWTFALQNLGPAGTGTTDMLDTTAINTTKLTGGSGITANIRRLLTLNGTPANLNTAAGDVLALIITKTGAPANLSNLIVRADETFQG